MKKNNTNKELAHYQGQGGVYVKVIDLTASTDKFAVGNIANIGGIVYVAGTDFQVLSSQDNYAQIGLDFQLDNLAEAINANSVTRDSKHSRDIDNGQCYARAAGKKLILYGRVPGVSFAASITLPSGTVSATIESTPESPSSSVPESAPQLTAPGVSDAFDTSQFGNHAFYITVANINTDVVVEAQGSADGTNYANIDSSAGQFTYTANGTYLLSKANFPMKNGRIEFVSESGGTAATIDIVYLGGN